MLAVGLPNLVEKELFKNGAESLGPLQKAIAFDGAVALAVLKAHRDGISKIAGTKDWAGLAAVLGDLITTGLATACGAELVKAIQEVFDEYTTRKKQLDGASDLLYLCDAFRALYGGWCLQVQCQIYRLRSQHQKTTPLHFGQQAATDVLALYASLIEENQRTA